uniref:Ig-like domain-containing protein n=1 Tax=Maylandia zebra TaxID=106582 RepID=A0A3P9BKT4_9CICH
EMLSHPSVLQVCPLCCCCVSLTATPEGLRVRQHPPSLSVMRGETATLSCHFKVESLKYGVQWFKSEQQLISNSSRQIVVAKNQTSSLVITNTTIQDSGWYYCEVNVLKKDPEWGNGTKLVVLGKKQIAGFRNEHAHNLLGPLRPGDVAMLVIMSHLYLLYTGATTFSTRFPQNHTPISGLSCVSPEVSTPVDSLSPGPTKAQQPLSITSQSPIAPFLLTSLTATCLNIHPMKPCCLQICW